MASKITIGIVLSAVGASAVLKSIFDVDTRIASIGKTLQELNTRQDKLKLASTRAWKEGGQSAEKYRHDIACIGDEITRVTALQKRLINLRSNHATNKNNLNASVGQAAAAWGLTRMAAAPVNAFFRQDTALNNLQVAMMDKTGKVGDAYKELKKQAIELGNNLPGTTADFANSATALMEQGMKIDAVVNGGLKAASHLAVVLKLPTDAAANMAAKLREAFALPDEALTNMADSMQRAKYAFGITSGDLLSATSYSAATMNVLGIKGEANMNKVLALQGMGAQVGLEGSSFGTNFAMMLSRLAKGPAMIEMAKRGMKGHAKELMQSMKVTFDFFDKKGNFKGVDNMVFELEKLNLIKKKYGEKAALEVADAMFGAEAGRPALIIAEKGKAGYEEAQQRMRDQASLQQRIDKISEGSKETWDRFTGTLENLGAAASGPLIKSLHPAINLLNNLTGIISQWLDEHPEAAKWIGVVAASVIGGTIAFLGMGVALSFAKYAITGFKLLPFIGNLGSLASGALAVGKAIMMMDATMLASPVTWILAGVAALAAIAWLVYDNWDVICKWWNGVWDDLKNNVNDVVNWFSGLPETFWNIGVNIVEGLRNGIVSTFNAVIDAIINLGAITAETFQASMKINSPSRLFSGYGQNIGAGLAIGIDRSRGLAKSAVSDMATTTANAWNMPALAVQAHDANAMLAQSASGSTQITFAPNVTVQGGDPAAVRSQIDQSMRLSFDEFERMMRQYEHDRYRVAYGRSA